MNRSRNLLAACSALFLIFILGYKITIHQGHPVRRFHAVIFDMDGTIIDTDHMWKSANGPILDSHAPHLTEAEKQMIIASFAKLTIYDVWKLIEQHSSVAISTEEIIQENVRHLHNFYQRDGIQFIPKFHEFHAKVQQHNLKTAIATSSEEQTVNVIVNIVPLADYFGEHIYHVDCVNKAYKPKPDVYLHAAKMLEVQPCHCIAIEDSPSGIKAAKAAGMYCIGINTSKNPALLAQADEIVDCFSEIDVHKLLFGK